MNGVDNYAQYDQLLNQYILFAKTVGFCIIAVLFGLMIFCLVVKYKRMALIVVVGGMVILCLLHLFVLRPYQKDVDENAYITYAGSFYVEDCYSVNRGGSYILLRYEKDSNPARYKVLCDISTIKKNTEYVGVVVYSKHAACLVDIQVRDKGDK